MGAICCYFLWLPLGRRGWWLHCSLLLLLPPELSVSFIPFSSCSRFRFDADSLSALTSYPDQSCVLYLHTLAFLSASFESLVYAFYFHLYLSYFKWFPTGIHPSLNRWLPEYCDAWLESFPFLFFSLPPPPLPPLFFPLHLAIPHLQLRRGHWSSYTLDASSISLCALL